MKTGRDKDAAKPETKALPKLSPRHKKWLEFYFGDADLNATEAARLAGIPHPNKQGPRIKARPDVDLHIKARLAELTMPPSEVLMRISRNAKANIKPFLNPDNPNEIDLKRAQENGQLHLLKGVKTKTRHLKDGEKEVTVEIKIPDQEASLRDLARIHGLFQDNLTVKASVTMSGEQLAEASKKGKGKSRKWRDKRAKGDG